jgi:hypothetical protein
MLVTKDLTNIAWTQINFVYAGSIINSQTRGISIIAYGGEMFCSMLFCSMMFHSIW